MDDRALLRHSLAVIAYRGGKPLRDAPASFADFDTGGGATPLTILAHISDLFDWALTMAKGETKWRSGTVEERLSHSLVKGIIEHLDDDVEEARQKYPSALSIPVRFGLMATAS